MGASPLKIVDIIFRAGWQVRNVHTVFDYLQREGVNDLEAAKACAGWITKINDRIWGGYTNKLEDLTDNVEKFQKFCSVLFHDDGLKYVRICVAMQCLAEQC
jgi:orotate phosphoribosyltransferase